MKDSAKKLLHGTRQTVFVTVVLMLICGLIFPLLLSGLSALIFPRQASGSLVEVNGRPVGAEHVGQEFTADYYMWSRPSQYHYNVYCEDKDGNITKSHYDTFDENGNQVFYQEIANPDEAVDTTFAGLSSGSTNYAPSNPDLAARVEADIEAFLARNPSLTEKDIPTDLLTASGSGLDPHITPASAEVQLPRIVEASGLSETQVRGIVERHTVGKMLGIFGEEMVNVLLVNIDLAQAMGKLG